MLDVKIAYDGLAASHHRMDMRRLGYALVGLDHILTHGVIAVAERRVVRSRERLEFDIVAGEPERGSLEIVAALFTAYQGAQSSLPFLIQALADKAPDFLWNWLSLVFKTLGGRAGDAEAHLEAVLDQMGKFHEVEKADRQLEREFVLSVIDKVAPHASKVAVPVGTSSNVLQFRKSGSTKVTEIGVAEAAAIRSKDDIEVGDPEVLLMRIDGLTKHTNRGTVELLSEPDKFVSVEIRDPKFDITPNDYIASMNSGETLKATAVPSYRAGNLVKLHIMGIVP